MPKRIMQGSVVSDKGDKTVVVRVERITKHPVLQKTLRRSKKFHAHDAENKYKIGDIVQICLHLDHWMLRLPFSAQGANPIRTQPSARR